MDYDVVIIGAGAAGLMCAIEAGKRGRQVLVIDHAKKPAEKIRISGGGRCNFTNIHASPEYFLSDNPRFCRSALSQYTQQDFVRLVEKYGIAYHEKTLGQLFCDSSSQEIITMLLKECDKAGVTLWLQNSVEQVQKTDDGFVLQLAQKQLSCQSLVIACGGKSIPKMGATGFGYEIAKQFGLNLIPTRAALVPLTFTGALLEYMKSLAGVSVDAEVRFQKKIFKEALLFTHRGLSGPAILQISSYWQESKPIYINLAPSIVVDELLLQEKEKHPKKEPLTVLSSILPKRLAQSIIQKEGVVGNLADMSNKKLQRLAQAVNAWEVIPTGTEGYRTAEVTIGGVDTRELSSKTMECQNVKGLYFIGEVVDVTGHLGGYNFQWAWSSGCVAGRNV